MEKRHSSVTPRSGETDTHMNRFQTTQSSVDASKKTHCSHSPSQHTEAMHSGVPLSELKKHSVSPGLSIRSSSQSLNMLQSAGYMKTGHGALQQTGRRGTGVDTEKSRSVRRRLQLNVFGAIGIHQVPGIDPVAPATLHLGGLMLIVFVWNPCVDAPNYALYIVRTLYEGRNDAGEEGARTNCP